MSTPPKRVFWCLSLSFPLDLGDPNRATQSNTVYFKCDVLKL